MPVALEVCCGGVEVMCDDDHMGVEMVIATRVYACDGCMPFAHAPPPTHRVASPHPPIVDCGQLCHCARFQHPRTGSTARCISHGIYTCVCR